MPKIDVYSIEGKKVKEVEQNIQIACKKANRNREEVTLIAVSKTQPVELLQEVYKEDVHNFGENKVQELCDKYHKIPTNGIEEVLNYAENYCMVYNILFYSLILVLFLFLTHKILLYNQYS